MKDPLHRAWKRHGKDDCYWKRCHLWPVLYKANYQMAQDNKGKGQSLQQSDCSIANFAAALFYNIMKEEGAKDHESDFFFLNEDDIVSKSKLIDRLHQICGQISSFLRKKSQFSERPTSDRSWRWRENLPEDRSLDIVINFLGNYPDYREEVMKINEVPAAAVAPYATRFMHRLIRHMVSRIRGFSFSDDVRGLTKTEVANYFYLSLTTPLDEEHMSNMAVHKSNPFVEAAWVRVQRHPSRFYEGEVVYAYPVGSYEEGMLVQETKERLKNPHVLDVEGGWEPPEVTVDAHEDFFALLRTPGHFFNARITRISNQDVISDNDLLYIMKCLLRFLDWCDSEKKINLEEEDWMDFTKPENRKILGEFTRFSRSGEFKEDVNNLGSKWGWVFISITNEFSHNIRRITHPYLSCEDPNPEGQLIDSGKAKVIKIIQYCRRHRKEAEEAKPLDAKSTDADKTAEERSEKEKRASIVEASVTSDPPVGPPAVTRVPPIHRHPHPHYSGYPPSYPTTTAFGYPFPPATPYRYPVYFPGPPPFPPPPPPPPPPRPPPWQG